MTPLERKELLDNPIILPLQNNRKWYEQAVLNGIDKGDFETFRTQTRTEITDFIGALNNSSEYAYVYCTLWYNYKGTLDGIPKQWRDEYKEFLKKCSTTETTTQKQEKQTMPYIDTTKAVQSITFIYGVNIADCSDDKFIATIRKLEEDIASLKSIQTQSNKILAKIKAMEDDLQALVTAFDNK